MTRVFFLTTRQEMGYSGMCAQPLRRNCARLRKSAWRTCGRTSCADCSARTMPSCFVPIAQTQTLSLPVQIAHSTAPLQRTQTWESLAHTRSVTATNIYTYMGVCQIGSPTAGALILFAGGGICDKPHRMRTLESVLGASRNKCISKLTYKRSSRFLKTFKGRIRRGLSQALPPVNCTWAAGGLRTSVAHAHAHI